MDPITFPAPRFSRRTLLRTGAWSVLGLVGLQALACNVSQTGSTTAPSTGGTSGSEKSPKPGGVFNMAYLSDFVHLDPHNGAVTIHIPTLVYNGLLMYKNDLTRQSEIEGDLAESWQQNDEKTYTFKLVPGVKWQNVAPTNGRELTSEDIKFFFERIARPNDPLKIYRDLYPFDKIELPDKTTVRVTLKVPFASFLSYVALPYALVIPKELDDANGGKTLTNVAVGTGPFIMKEYSSSTSATLEKNPNYFKKGLPYLDGIKYVVMADHGTMFTAFRTGRLDATPQALGSALTVPEVKILESQMQDKVIIQQVGSLLWVAIRFNSSKPPYNILKVRQALSMVLDRDQMLKTLWDGRGKIDGPLPWGLTQFALPESELRQNEIYQVNLTKAKQLLSEAGFPNGFKTEGLISATGGVSPNVDAALLVKDQWAKIGVEATIKPIESTPWNQEMANSNFEWTLFSHSGFFDPDDYFMTHLRTGATRNYGKVSDPKLDALADKQRVTTDQTERKKVVDELQRHLIEQAYFAYLYSFNWQLGFYKYVKNFVLNPIPWANHRHWDKLWLDK